jgi:phage-related minor tail protein
MARRSKLASHGAFGDALVGEATLALSTLRGLIEHPALSHEPETVALKSTVEQVEQRLSRGELCVVVAGETGAGKRTFVDALLGDRRLGEALGDARLSIFIRNNAWYDYVARFVGGRSEEFASRVPDHSDQLNAAIDELSQALARADSELSAALVSDARARERLAAAEQALAAGRRAHADAQAGAEQAETRLDELRTSGESAREALVKIEQAIPRSLQSRPRWWAVWLWLMLALFLVARRSAWKTWHARRRAHDQMIARLPAMQQQTSDAAAAQERAESALAQLEAGQRDAVSRAAEAREALARAECERQRLEVAIAEQREQLERGAAARLELFFTDLRRLSELSMRSKQLLEIEIDYPARRLPEDVMLVDSPGIISQDEQERARARDRPFRPLHCRAPRGRAAGDRPAADEPGSARAAPERARAARSPARGADH